MLDTADMPALHARVVLFVKSWTFLFQGKLGYIEPFWAGVTNGDDTADGTGVGVTTVELPTLIIYILFLCRA